MAEPLFILPVADIDLDDPAGAVADLLMDLATATPGRAAAVRMPPAQVAEVAGRLPEMCETYLAEGEPGESFRLIVRPWPNGWTDVALVYEEPEPRAGGLAEEDGWVS